MADKNNNEKLQGLRGELQKKGLAGYMVPRADEWQGEYVPARAERLSWLTGFTGSAGQALILEDKAAVYSDTRYTEQMKNELGDTQYDGETQTKDNKNTPGSWLLKNVPEGSQIGYDPRLYTVKQIEKLQKEIAEKKIELVPVDGNLVDEIWNNQPDHPMDEVVVYPEKYAGQSFADKRVEISGDVKKAGAKAVLLTAPDSIAWLLNIRGSDVPNVPIALSYAVLHENGDVDWFIPAAKVSAEVKQHIGNKVQIHEFEDMPDALKNLAKDNKILLDENTTPIWFNKLLIDAGATTEHMDDPIVWRKALKNETERKYITEGHVQDGVALVKFWKWIDENALNGTLTELDGVAKLRELREEREGFKDTSFDAIVGWAAHGAVVHYRADEKSNATITKDSLLLVDSGGQYLGCTTDNTRTRAIGTPTNEMKESFTRVLKGHIAIADARFKEGATGRDMDVRARQFLNKAELDYGHGTGHGVGAYLSVHESGVGIHEKFDKPLKAGMLVSNEPGYYQTDENGIKDEYGIRIENLVFVEETGDEELKYKFNTVSLTPIDQNLIDIDLLDSDEIKWLNEYHQKVYDNLAPHLDADEKTWLKKETAPLSRVPAP